FSLTHCHLLSFPTRRSSDLAFLFRIFLVALRIGGYRALTASYDRIQHIRGGTPFPYRQGKLLKTPSQKLNLQPGEIVQVKSHARSEEHTSELQSRGHLVCRL